VKNAREAESAFKEALEEGDVGIIIITERTAELIRLQVDRYMFTEQFPLILEIPDRMGKVAGKPDIRSMVNQAIGIKL
jgi:V/A-type H+-transporting ATPase subunit F